MTIGPANVPDAILSELCRKWRITRIALFGSAQRGELRLGSDIDLLVDFEPGENWSLMDLARAEAEFADAFGFPVDLVDRRSLERGANRVRSDAILGSAEVVYAP